MTNSSRLRTALMAIEAGQRGEPRRSVNDMAAELGIKAPQWSLIRHGRRAISRDVARAAVKRWPELADDYWADLMDEQVQEYDREEREEVPA